MNKCIKCGVELDVEMNYCPLCGQKSTQIEIDTRQVKSEKASAIPEKLSYNLDELTQIQRVKLFWEMSGIILFSGMIVTTIIDIIINKQISWSKYSIAIGLFLLINFTLITFLNKRVVLLLLGSFITSASLMLVFDIYTQFLDWGLKLGIPIVFFIYIILFLLVFCIQKSRQKGINIIAYFLIAIGILCVCIESIISLHQINQLKLHWSLITLTSLVSVSGIILFIHYRLKRATDLKRFFHI